MFQSFTAIIKHCNNNNIGLNSLNSEFSCRNKHEEDKKPVILCFNYYHALDGGKMDDKLRFKVYSEFNVDSTLLFIKENAFL